MVSVEWSGDALQDLERIDSVIAKRIVLKVTWLGENFPATVPERLKRNLKGLYKLEAPLGSEASKWGFQFEIGSNLVQ